MKNQKTPAYWNGARRELSRRHPKLAPVIKRHRTGGLTSRGSAFETLARSIVGQQISTKAAASVWKKFLEKVGKAEPRRVLDFSVAELRTCGLSARKAEYILDLAHHFDSGRIQPRGWSRKSDVEIIEELTNVKGVGVWTAEMFLIFHLLRPNVFPAQDMGVQKAISNLYGVRYPMSKTQLKRFRQEFHPWSSVAVWHLWRSLDSDFEA